MRLALLVTLLTLTGCNAVPVRDPVTAPVVLTRTVERYIPIDPALTAPAVIANPSKPSEIANVAAERKRALTDCNVRMREIANLQGAIK